MMLFDAPTLSWVHYQLCHYVLSLFSHCPNVLTLEPSSVSSVGSSADYIYNSVLHLHLR